MAPRSKMGGVLLLPAGAVRGGAVREDVGGLQQGVAEEAVGAEILLPELFDLVLVGRYALQPRQRRDEGEQQVQLRVLGYLGLDEHGALVRVDADGQPVDQHVPDRAAHDVRRGIIGGQRMPVGGEEETVVFLLQREPVLQHALQMPKVQAAGGPHTGEHAHRIAGFLIGHGTPRWYRWRAIMACRDGKANGPKIHKLAYNKPVHIMRRWPTTAMPASSAFCCTTSPA